MSLKAVRFVLLLFVHLTTAHSGIAQTCLVDRVIVRGGAASSPLVFPVDVESDGDTDVIEIYFNFEVSTDPIVRWHVNDGGALPGFSETVLPIPDTDLLAVVGEDLDGDGDQDLVGAFGNGNPIRWLENTAAQPGDPPIFVERALPGPASTRFSVCDIEGDTDKDVVIPSSSGLWLLENGGGTNPSFGSREITTGSPTTQDAWCTDIDGDNDQDILAILNGNQLVLFTNDGLTPPAFVPTVLFEEFDIFTEFPENPELIAPFEYVASADLDGDLDEDIILTLFLQGIIWLESDGLTPPSFNARLAFFPTDGFLQGRTIPADLDGDGDIDLGTSTAIGGSIGYLENMPGPPGQPPSFALQDIILLATDGLEGSFNMADLDGDLDSDFIAGTGGIDVSRTIRWFENASTFNATAGEAESSLAEAIANAMANDVIIADPGQFTSECTNTIDLTSIPLTIQSTSAVDRVGETTTILSSGSTIAAAPGFGVEVTGSISIPAAATATLEGASIELAGDIALDDNATLVVDGDTCLLGAAAFVEQPVLLSTDGAGSLLFRDINSDGLVDAVLEPFGSPVLGQVVYSWLENLGTDPPTFVRREFAFGAGAASLADLVLIGVEDVDLDNDQDLLFSLGVSEGGPATYWFENDGASSPTFSERLIASTVVGTAIDLDADGRVDILSGATWLRNQAGIGGSPEFVEQVVAGAPTSPVIYADLDGDGDLDATETGALGGSASVWYRNDGLPAPGFSQGTVLFGGGPTGAFPVIVPIDSDARNDVIYRSVGGAVYVYRNLGTTNGDQDLQLELVQTLTNIGAGATGSFDADSDGDTDLVFSVQGALLLYENNGAVPPQFERRAFDDTAIFASGFAVADIEDDGDEDLGVVFAGVTGFQESSFTIFRNLLATDFILDGIGTSVEATGSLILENKVARVALSNTLQSSTAISLDSRSLLAGSGAVTALQVNSAGTIAPDTGTTFTINGDLVQQFDDGVTGLRSGDVLVDLGDLSSPTRLAVTGNAALSGGLLIISDAPIDQNPGPLSDVVSAASITGRFDVAYLPGVTPDELGNGRFVRVQYPGGVQRSDGSRGVVSVSLVVDTLTGDIATDPAATFGVAGEPTDAAVADLNGDGLIDLALSVPDDVAPASAPGSVIVLLNQGVDGSNNWLGFSGSIQVTVGVNPSAIDIGNADGAGGLDIAVANRNDDTVNILSNNGALTPILAVAQTLAAGNAPQSVRFGDIDNDKFDDLAFAATDDDEVRVFGDQAGGPYAGFSTLSTPSGPVDIQFADIDNDKFDDLVVAASGASVVRIFDNNLGTFAPGPVDIGVGAAPVELAIADIDNDKFDDLATVNKNGDSISVALNLGGFSFTTAVDLPVGDTPSSIAAVDLDQDGDRDLAVVATVDGSSVIQTLRNDLFDGQVQFAPAIDVDSGGSPVFVRAGDVNNDFLDDLIAVNDTTGALALRMAARGMAVDEIGVVLQAVQASACDGDSNGDDVVDVNDISYVLFRLGDPCGAPGCDGDANGDGTVDVNDISYVLFRLGDPC